MFILGLLFGSYYKCVIDNYPTYLSHKRSKCPMCNHTLRFIDLIPVLSYLLQKGKCRYCHNNIGLSYLGYELSFGFIFLSYYLLPLHSFIITICLICISISDYKYGIIYDTCLIIILFTILISQDIYYSLALYTLTIGTILSINKLVGFGDIKLLTIFSLYFTYQELLIALLIACILAIIKERKRIIFFAPYLAIGLFFVMVT